VGGLLFLLAEGGEDAKRVFGLLPQLETKQDKKNNVLQVSRGKKSLVAEHHVSLTLQHASLSTSCSAGFSLASCS
jgi:hypothetical protein